MPTSAARTRSNRTGTATAAKPAPPPLKPTTVSRWGNSLGVRIPQDAVDQLKLRPGAKVTFELHGGAITIRPVRTRRKWTEAELLKGVTPEMAGGEVDWGSPVGKEIW